MKELIQHLEAAVLSRNPSQTKRLQSGLTIEQIRKELKRAGIAGKVGPIVGLYSWRNGTNLQGFGSEAVKAGFVPSIEVQLSENIKQLLLLQGIKRETDFKTYNFIELEMALLHQNGYKKSAKNLERYFPILWDGSTNWIAVDIDPSGCNKVVTIQKRDNPPLREAYPTFEEFLKDVIRANETNEPLTCLRTPGKPITGEPESHSTLARKGSVLEL